MASGVNESFVNCNAPVSVAACKIALDIGVNTTTPPTPHIGPILAFAGIVALCSGVTVPESKLTL